MQYPLISEYVRAIQDASDNLGELAHLVPVLDNHGEPYRSSGAFAVVFKMKDEQTGKCFALKCFTEDQEGRAEAYHRIADELKCVGSSYLTSVKYLEKEIFVDSSCVEEEFPVLLMDWVDGETMETYIAANYRDEYAMKMLCYRFSKMASWLRSQPFAHGDIKPDNIMVRPDGSLTLVDYDGMFVPAMNGQKSPTIGTKDFSHPSRTVDDFDETIDDFALASIALSLKAISLKPSLLDEYGASDRLLFSADDYLNMSKSKVVTALQELMNDEEIKTLFSLFILASAKKNLALSSFRLFIVKKPENKIEVLSTKVSEEDFADSVMDEYGVEYSRDGKRLLKAPHGLVVIYKIKVDTKVICDSAFCGCDFLESLVIPDSVTSIGNGAFSGCNSLESIVIPKSVRIMVGNPFINWKGDLSVLSTNFIYDIGGLIDVKKEKIIAFLRDDTSYVIPDSVTSIGNSAFGCCDSLESLVIPDSVTSIGDSAFWCCDSLESLVISGNVTSIGYRAFSRCRSLESIVIPDSVTSIGDYAFGDCSSLESIVIPNSVTSIGDSTFSGCVSLESIVIPDSATNIGDSAFSGCVSLESIVIPDSVTSIGDGVFYGCDSLERIIIPKSVRIMSGNPFRNWKGDLSVLSTNFIHDRGGLIDVKKEKIIAFLRDDTSYVIPDSVTSIGDYAFWNCGSLESLVIPDSVTSIGNYAFGDCGSLRSIVIPDGVTSIGDCAFIGCNSLESIVIPDGVTSIGNRAFSGCRSLKSIVIPKSVRIMSGNPFRNWKGDLSVLSTNFIYDRGGLIDVKKEKIIAFVRDDSAYIIPDSVTSIGDEAFGDCGSLESIVIPKSVTSIGDYAFGNCGSLESIVIPKSVTSIGDSAFWNCDSLESIVIPNSVMSIGDEAFGDCGSLESIVIPNSVMSIGDEAFEDCGSLASIVIPNSVTSIGNRAFSGCRSLKSVVIPNSVTNIGDEAFRSCSSLESLVIPNSVRIMIGNPFSCWKGGLSVLSTNFIYDRDVLFDVKKEKIIAFRSDDTSYVIPDSVTSIGDRAFYGCDSLESLVIPDSVTSIGDRAFEGCYFLKSIAIPDSVRSIGNSAFKGCYLLNDIITEEGARVIIIESKRKKRENILKQYPDAIIADVTSHATDGLIKLSPFYPHGGIPVPFSEGVTATCVEAVWQGLKVFETEDVDINMFRNDTMKNIKRTVRQFGRPLGHRKGVNGTELLGYIEARKQIYIPTYQWMLEHKVPDIIKRLKKARKRKTIVLLDYNTNCDVDDPTKPLSHAFLIKAYVEGLYPYGEKKEIEVPF